MKKFKRTIENFKCEHCGEEIKGDGYTNHCPFCLWSKHVDVNPGDRANECGGMMEPVKAFYEKDHWFATQKCEKCGEMKKIKLRDNDNLKVVEEIIAKDIH